MRLRIAAISCHAKPKEEEVIDLRTLPKVMAPREVGFRECKISLTEEGKNVRIPVLGRFNSVVEKKSWSQSFRELSGSLPWIIILISLIQIVVFYTIDSNKTFDLSLPSDVPQDQDYGWDIDEVSKV